MKLIGKLKSLSKTNQLQDQKIKFLKINLHQVAQNISQRISDGFSIVKN